MVRISALRNRPVVFENRQIGFLQSVSLDQAQKRVQALIISRGLRGKCAILPADVTSISDQFILAERISRFDRSYETGLCGFARDTTGILVGRITDYALRENSMTVSAIEIMPGFLPPESRIRIWIFTYQRQNTHTLTIPSLLCEEPTFSGEGI